MKKKNKLFLYCASYCIIAILAIIFIFLPYMQNKNATKVIKEIETAEEVSTEVIEEVTEEEDKEEEETQIPQTETVSEEKKLPLDFVNRTKSNVHIRNNPSMKGKIIGKIPPSQKGVITDFFNTEWAMVTYNGLKGYSAFRYFNVFLPDKGEVPISETISQNEVTPSLNTSSKDKVIIINSCYIRNSTNSHTMENVIDIAKKDTVYTHLEKNDTEFWCCILLPDGREGFVSKGFSEIMQ